MSVIAPVLDQLSAEVAEASATVGRRVDVASLRITDRAGELPLAPPGRTSPNGACRLLAAADGWLALNLARPEDRDLVPAWLECDVGADAWALAERHARARPVADLVDRATLLGLPAAAVGEARAQTCAPPWLARGAPDRRRDGPFRALDLSALWAGPLCGAVLAAAGVEVVRVESLGRPDPTREHTPAFFHRLNAAKAEVGLDLTAPQDRARLATLIAGADVLVTGLRPRALAGLGLSEAGIFAVNPSLIWVAVTGHGWTGPSASRVAFGDDAAAAGGLVGQGADGAPRFLGDALSDPLTGLAAAAAALRALAEGGGVLIDAALARTAAGAARLCGLAA